MAIETILLWSAVLVLISVLASKLSDKLAIPALLVFLLIGMLAGSEGLGQIEFNNPHLAKSVGIVALIFIIFSGGLDTNWKDIKPILRPGIVLSTLGVLLTAMIIAAFAVVLLHFSYLEGLLLGSIVSSTDAAAVFSILRSKRLSLKPPLRPLLEFESGSNDPMAVFLTLGFISILSSPGMSVAALIPRFFLDIGIGAAIGLLMPKAILFLFRRVRLDFEGLYPVLMMALVLLTYAITSLARGNGFLAVYITGLALTRAEFRQKKPIMRFHDGLAWLMQITMFLTLGLLVFPSHIIPVMGSGILLAAILMLVARPLSVWLCLLPFKMAPKKKLMISWVGLRGAAPIILATFPLLAGFPQAETIFNTIFFVVITSVLIQGTSIPLVSKFLRLDTPMSSKKEYPFEFERTQEIDAEFTDIIVPYASSMVGKKIRELDIPDKCLIVLISRDEKYLIPSGGTELEGGDVLLVLASATDLAAFQQVLAKLNPQSANE